MSTKTLFLGSSSAAKSQAKEIAKTLTSEEVKFLPWWEAFTPGRTLLEELDDIRARVQGAVLIFSPEADATVRGNIVQTPNLNVLFEFGYFYGHFGKKKVAMMKYGDFYLPSDFGGYIHIFGSNTFRRSAAKKVGSRTLTEFARWVKSADFEVNSGSSPTADGSSPPNPTEELKDRLKSAESYRRSRDTARNLNWRTL